MPSSLYKYIVLVTTLALISLKVDAAAVDLGVSKVAPGIGAGGGPPNSWRVKPDPPKGKKLPDCVLACITTQGDSKHPGSSCPMDKWPLVIYEKSPTTDGNHMKNWETYVGEDVKHNTHFYGAINNNNYIEVRASKGKKQKGGQNEPYTVGYKFLDKTYWVWISVGQHCSGGVDLPGFGQNIKFKVAKPPVDWQKHP